MPHLWRVESWAICHEPGIFVNGFSIIKPGVSFQTIYPSNLNHVCSHPNRCLARLQPPPVREADFSATSLTWRWKRRQNLLPCQADHGDLESPPKITRLNLLVWQTMNTPVSSNSYWDSVICQCNGWVRPFIHIILLKHLYYGILSVALLDWATLIWK